MSDFWRGLWFWARGWRMIFDSRRLFTLALLPTFIALLSTGGLFWLLWNYLPDWIQSLLRDWMGLSSGITHDLLYYPMVAAGAILSLISSIYVVYVVQMLVAVPFYSLLADRTLFVLGKKPEEPRVWRLWVHKTLRMLRVSLLRAGVLLILGLFLFLFSFVPVLNVVAVACALLILASDCADYAFEALGYGFRARVGYLLREWKQWFGMGAGLGLTLLVPGLTLLIIPGAVVGAAAVLKVKNES